MKWLNVDREKRFASVVQSLVVLAAIAVGSLLLSPHAAGSIFAKFGNIEGSAMVSEYTDWTPLVNFELTAGSLDPSLQVFEAKFSFSLDKTYPPLLSESFAQQALPIEIAITNTFESSGSLPVLEYEIDGAIIGPLTVTYDSILPMVSGSIFSARELDVTYTERDESGNTSGQIKTNYKYDSGKGSATLSALSGDYNLDGDVDSDDLDVWEQLYGGTNLVADGNGSGNVDGVDFLVWQRQSRTSTHIAASTIVVPEPSVFVLAAISISLCVLQGRRGQWLA